MSLQTLLQRLLYLYFHTTRPDGQPIDPVERFHLGNGARIERVNWLVILHSFTNPGSGVLEEKYGLPLGYIAGHFEKAWMMLVLFVCLIASQGRAISGLYLQLKIRYNPRLILPKRVYLCMIMRQLVSLKSIDSLTSSPDAVG